VKKQSTGDCEGTFAIVIRFVGGNGWSQMPSHRFEAMASGHEKNSTEKAIHVKAIHQTMRSARVPNKKRVSEKGSIFHC